MHSFEVHSNESACRKIGRLGLEQVLYVLVLMEIGLQCHKIILLFFYKAYLWSPFNVKISFLFSGLHG